MKKLGYLLTQLTSELERRTPDEDRRRPPGGHAGDGTTLSPGRLQELEERLKPIIEELKEHQSLIEAEEQLRALAFARITEITRFQAAEIQAIIESLPDAVFIWTKEKITLCNSYALRMLGVSSLEDLGNYPQRSSYFSFRWPDGMLLTEGEFPVVRALKGETAIAEFIATPPNTAADLHIRAAAAPILEDGKVVGAVAIHTDITGHKTKEEELRRAYEKVDKFYQELKYQTAELNAVIEAIPDGILIGDSAGVRRCNTQGLNMLGALNLEELQTGLPTLLERFKIRWADTKLPLRPEETAFAKAMNGESVVQELLHTDLRTGEERIHRSSGAPVVLNGEVIAAVSVNTDITASVKAKSELETLNAHLDQLVQCRTQELTQTNDSLQKALMEVKNLKEHLEAENVYLHIENDRQYNFGEVIGESSSLKEVFRSIEAVAPQDTTVLLLGETGTGKGMLARAIHARSGRKERPMVMVNCTSLPANLIESELFGREKGAFTGAHAQQIGRFELADKGTIFLDEIGDLPLELQAKLLHVLQEKEFSRLGSPRTIKVDVRIIAATNRDLKGEVVKGRFREDLYYRLNIFPVLIPPLRQRKEDIPLLVEFCINKFCREMGKTDMQISSASMNKLVNHSWPGNVRELENVIERAVIASRGSTLQIMEVFDPPLVEGGPEAAVLQPLADVERAYILKVLRQTQGRLDGKHGAALILGLNPSTLRGRMRKEGINRSEWI